MQINVTNIQDILNKFNDLTHSLLFTMKDEFQNKINFLDITTSKGKHNLQFTIFKKPRFTHIITPKNPYDPLLEVSSYPISKQ